MPSSYNELYSNMSIRYHIGWTWYNRQFFVNNFIRNSVSNGQNLIFLRIESCHYFCIVWLNGHQIGQHESGHLPFEFDISSLILIDDPFNLVIAVNNTLTAYTIPPAGLFFGTDPNLYPKNYVEQNLQMDFFNYAGLHREVLIYVKPAFNIQDIFIQTIYSNKKNGNL